MNHHLKTGGGPHCWEASCCKFLYSKLLTNKQIQESSLKAQKRKTLKIIKLKVLTKTNNSASLDVPSILSTHTTVIRSGFYFKVNKGIDILWIYIKLETNNSSKEQGGNPSLQNKCNCKNYETRMNKFFLLNLLTTFSTIAHGLAYKLW